MEINPDFYSMLLDRTALHFVGALLVGAAFVWKPKLYIIPIALIVAKEIFLDPHPTEEYWIKSILDTAVWLFGFASAYFIYKGIKQDKIGDNEDKEHVT